MEPDKTKQKASAYGKRPTWQWVLIYVVIAAIVYAAIYFLFIHKSGSTAGSSGSLGY